MDQNISSRDGTSLAYESAGRGATIVLVSGAMSTGATVAPLAAPLSERFRVVVYDRRRRGASGDTPPYAVEREVEDLAALIEATGGEAALYGVSSGGALALRAAASGLPVRQVAVYETPYAMSQEDLAERARYTERLAAALEEGRRGRRGGALPPAHGAGRRGDPQCAAVADVGGHGGAGAEPGVRRRRDGRRERAAGDAGVDPGAGAVDRGRREPGVDASGGAGHRGVGPRGAYRTLEGQTHMVEPDVLAPVLAEFFSR